MIYKCCLLFFALSHSSSYAAFASHPVPLASAPVETHIRYGVTPIIQYTFLAVVYYSRVSTPIIHPPLFSAALHCSVRNNIITVGTSLRHHQSRSLLRYCFFFGLKCKIKKEKIKHIIRDRWRFESTPCEIT